MLGYLAVEQGEQNSHSTKSRVVTGKSKKFIFKNFLIDKKLKKFQTKFGIFLITIVFAAAIRYSLPYHAKCLYFED